MKRSVLLALVLAARAVSGLLPARAGAPADVGEAARRGAAFLLRTRLPAGGWVSDEYGLTSPGHKLAITAVAAHALLATGDSPEVREAVRKAVGFTSRYVREIGERKIHHGFDFNAWGVAYGLVHLRGVVDRWAPGEDPPDVEPVIERFLGYAKEMQRPCGGWDYRTRDRNGAPLRDGSIPFLTAVMLDGLRLWRADGRVVARGLEDLRKSADAKGFVGYSQEGGSAGDTGRPGRRPAEAAGRSLQARLTLVLAGRAEPATLLPLLEYFFRVRGEYEKVRNAHPHTPPLMIAGYYYYHAHYYAMRAIRRLLAADPGLYEKVMPWVGVLREALLREQAEDGHWIDAPCGGKPYATALALLEIADLREVLVPWHDSLPAALEQARETGRPVLLLLTDRGEASRRMVSIFYEPSFRDLLRRVVLLRADIGARREIARRAKVYRAPALLLLDPGAEDPLKTPLRKVIGRRKPEKVRSLIEKVLEEIAPRSR